MKPAKTAEISQKQDKLFPVSYNLSESIIALVAAKAAKSGHKSRSEWLNNFLREALKNA